MIDVSVIFVLISYNLFEIYKERNRKIFLINSDCKNQIEKNPFQLSSLKKWDRKSQNLKGRAEEIRNLSLV